MTIVFLTEGFVRYAYTRCVYIIFRQDITVPRSNSYLWGRYLCHEYYNLYIITRVYIYDVSSTFPVVDGCNA